MGSSAVTSVTFVTLENTKRNLVLDGLKPVDLKALTASILIIHCLIMIYLYMYEGHLGNNNRGGFPLPCVKRLNWLNL